jgi:phosphohistidine swiveling domain-containing protein
MKKPFSKSAEIFRWSPIPGKFFYISDFWNIIFMEYPRKYSNYCWPKTLIVFKEGKIVWINDFHELRRIGGKAFIKFMVPEVSRKRLKLDWYKKIKLLSKLEHKIDSTDLSSLSDKQLLKLSNQFIRKLYDFWIPTIIVELGNYGSSEILEAKIKSFIKDNAERLRAMEVLCAPEKLSFYQEEEVELLKTKDIKKHTKNYFWLNNSYDGVKILAEDFFQKRKSRIDNNLEKELKEKIVYTRESKKVLADRFGLSHNIMQFAEAVVEGIEFQDERKKFIFISLHYKNLFLQEIARRRALDVQGLYGLNFGEMLGIINGDIHIYKQKIKDRSKPFGFLAGSHGRLVEINRVNSEKYWNEYASEKITRNREFVKGVVVSSGAGKMVRARVRILLDLSDSDKFKKGEILVATMTSPEYIFAIKKASAVITDSGGLTSHAAIVTRELNKPCLVGTKFATQIFHDGDMVEIDTNQGTARIIK